MQLHTINTGFFKLDGGAMFGVVPKVIWQKLNPADDKNLCTWAMRCLLAITDDNRRILIDTGIGSKQSEKFFSFYDLHGNDSLLGSLQQHGLQAEDITDVILTHLHFDHVGGAVTRTEAGSLVPTFSNALYWTNEEHWAAALQPNAREKASFLSENILPLYEAGVLRFATDNGYIYPQISVKFVYGHTTAMMLPHIAYKNTTLVYCADLIPSAGHIKQAYVMGYDMQPLVTLAEKKQFTTRAAQEKHILFFEHDPHTEAATVEQTATGDFAIARRFDLKDYQWWWIAKVFWTLCVIF